MEVSISQITKFKLSINFRIAQYLAISISDYQSYFLSLKN